MMLSSFAWYPGNKNSNLNFVVVVVVFNSSTTIPIATYNANTTNNSVECINSIVIMYR